MPYRIVENPTLEETQCFRSLKGKHGHIDEGIFIAEGPKIARVVLRSEYEVIAAFLTEEHFSCFAPLLEASKGETRVMLAPKEEMERVVGYPLHQGIMLAVRIPDSPPIASIIAITRTHS